MSRLQFNKDQKEKMEILHWVGTNILTLQWLVSKTLQDPILSKTAERIRRNRWSNCSKRPYKEIRHKLTMENSDICNGDVIV